MEPVWLLAILICPLVMGLMMFFMMRGMRGGSHGERPREESPPPEREAEAAER